MVENWENQTDIFNPVMYKAPAPSPYVAAGLNINEVTKGQAPTYLIRDEKQAVNIPVLAIYPNKIVGYTEIQRTWQRSLIGIQNEEGKPANDTAGKISLPAKKRIQNAVNWLYYLSKEKITVKNRQKFTFKINLITLTLPSKQKHSDKYIKKEMLNAFLEWMRYKGVKSYIWKAEPQKNGNIHFHITTNIFIHWKEIRDKWNKICKKEGYLQPYTDKFKNLTFEKYVNLVTKEGTQPDLTKLRAVYDRGEAENWQNPNSTDVHSVKKVRKLAAYVAKYLTKESNIRKIEGRQWFLSTNMSNIKAPVICYDTEVHNQFLNLSALKSSFVKNFDYASILFYDIREAIKNKCTAFIDELIQLTFEKSHVIN